MAGNQIPGLPPVIHIGVADRFHLLALQGCEIMSDYYSYLKKLGLFTGLLAILFVAGVNLFPGIGAPSKSIATFLVLFAVTAIGHYLLIKAPADKQKMIVFTLVAIVVKLVLYGVFAVLLIFADKQDAIPNIALFFILYLCFTVFDIYQQRGTQKARESS
jgi:hypothetical protein